MGDTLLGHAKLRTHLVAGTAPVRPWVAPLAEAMARARVHWLWLCDWYGAIETAGGLRAARAELTRPAPQLLGNEALTHVKSFMREAAGVVFYDLEEFHAFLRALLVKHGGAIEALRNDEAMLECAQAIFEDPSIDHEDGDEIVVLTWGTPVDGRRPLVGW